jgi:hypothetical protein
MNNPPARFPSDSLADLARMVSAYGFLVVKDLKYEKTENRKRILSGWIWKGV